MRKLLLLVILITAFFSKTYAVPAYPFPIKYKQPDGSEITIKLKGDERVHWAETTDGYTLLGNGKNGWEYAVKDNSGDLKVSGVLAREASKRTANELKLLRGVSKNIRFSPKQVNLLKSVWEAKHGSEKLVGTSGFLKPNTVNSRTNDGKQKVFSPKGHKRLLMILIEFKDVKFKHSKAEFYALMNTQHLDANGFVSNGTSVRDYFLEQSYNQFDVETDVVGIYTAKNNMDYYGSDASADDKDTHSDELMLEAVQDASDDAVERTAGFSFVNYDNDGDGSVDGVYIVYAGYGQATSGIANTIWPHAGGIAGKTFDGKTVSKYSCSNELTYNSNLSIKDITTIGVICHEFGHVCGAPDYYDTDYGVSGGTFPGTGYWDVMCYGVYNGSPIGSQPAHMNPYEKVRNGWVTPTLLTSATSLTIPDITTNPVIYKYNTSTPNEYFLMENRQQTGFNTACPGHGLLIYHADGTYISNHEGSNDINVGPHQGFYPVCANSEKNISSTTTLVSDYGSVSSQGCPFPGSGSNTSFTDATTPNSLSWAGATTGMPITNISEASNAISFYFKGNPTVNAVVGVTATPMNATQINLSWIKNSNSNDVIVATNSTTTFGTPVTGSSYNVGDVLPSGGTIIYKGSASAFSHTGLTATTTYYYQVWAVDGSLNYSEGSPANATTLISSVSSFPFIEGFNSTNIPANWTQEYRVGTIDWKYVAAGAISAVAPAVPHTGANFAYCGANIVASYTTKLISPPLDLLGATSPVLKFWYNQFPRTGYGPDVLRVFYRTSVTAAWTLLTTYNDTPSNWTLKSITLPNPSATYYIAFEATTNTGYGVCVDDIEVWNTPCSSNLWIGGTAGKETDWFTASNWSCGVPTLATDVEIPSTTNSPVINAIGAVCHNITIDNGATLAMDAATAYTLAISGNWTNNAGGTAFTAGIGTVSFQGTDALQTIGGTSTTNFNILEVKTGAIGNVLEATATISFPTSPTTNPLVLTSGTFKLSSSSTINLSSNQFDINGGLWNNGGSINSTSNNVVAYGYIKNSLGTCNLLRLYYGSSSSILIDGGTVNISGQIRPLTAGSSTTSFSQTGGTLNFTVGTASGSAAPFELTSGSSFTMSGGTIVIQKTSSSNSNDYYNLANKYNVTGGTLQIGNGSTATNQTIRINSIAPIYNLTVNSYNSPTAKIKTNNLSVLNDVTIASGSVLQVSPLIGLTVGGTFTNNAGNTGFVLQSDATGTGTFLDNGSTNSAVAATVQQYLTTGRNWYISTPVTNTTSAVFSANATNPLYYYDEVNGTSAPWPTITNTTTSLGVMKGYVANVASTGAVAFTGNLNTGAQSITTLTRTAGQTKEGFNLVGNPYPSYLNWMLAIDASNTGTTNLLTTVWYRTKNNATTPAYVFDTYNETANTGTNNNGVAAVTGMISPMQAFWVRVAAGQTSGTLAINNAMRLHQDVATNKFRVPAANATQKVLRLQVSNGTNSDETIVLFNANATDGYDAYDSPKMTNGNASIPEIYTFAGTEKAVINGLNSIATNSLVPLGFSTGAANTFSIKATEVTDFDTDTRIVLKDKVLNVEQDITSGTPYTFTSDATSTENRFAIIFKSASAITGIDNPTENTDVRVSKNADNQIVITRNVDSQSGVVTICNTIGQKLLTTTLTGETTVISKSFSPGVYLVTVNNITKKVIIN